MAAVYQTGDDEKLREYIGEDLYSRQRSLRHVCVPLKDDAYFLEFYRCDIKDTRSNDERICIFCSERELVLFGVSAHSAGILKEIPQQTEPFGVLAEYLFELTAGDVDQLETVENDINELERRIITTEHTIKGASARIIELRRAFLKIKRYYEHMGIVVDRLAENENGAIPAETLNRFGALSRRVQYLLKSVTDLREYVTQVREAYQASIDIEQNQIMKVFTVMTSIFLPLTLIVGWYGMNFSMPELTWRFGYLYVTILSVAVCAICVIIFKKKKWF